MIPISCDPKRFVAALNKTRFTTCLSKNVRRSLPAALSLPVSVSTSASIATIANRTSYINKTSSHAHYLSLSTCRTLCTASPSAAAAAVDMQQPETEVEQFYEDSMQLRGPRGPEWWSGKAPEACPGFVKDCGRLFSLPQVSLDPAVCTKQALQNYFDNTWTLTELLLSSLQGEEAFMRSPYHNLRHPMIFYYGHPAAVYVNKMRVAGLIKDPVNPYFESVFETGVDEMSWDDLSKNKMPWPSVAEVHAYRKKVYDLVSNLIQGLTPAQCANINHLSPLWSLVMGFEHERIHLETSSLLINELPLQFIRFPQGFPDYHPTKPSPENEVQKPISGVHYPVNKMIDVPAQTISIGKPRNFPSFGWDNEYGLREYEVPAFKASTFKITNGEFWEFVKDNGYARRELWTEVGWKWRAFRNVKWPTFWKRKGPQGHHEYDMRLIFDESPMAWNWPVCVNYHESVAFAKWKSAKSGKHYRIMTELEHRAIRNPVTGMDVDNEHVLNHAGNEMGKTGFNVNLAYSSYSPVDAYPVNQKGFADVFGNAWEWTEDYFCPLPGFEIHPYYEDFSTPCFDGLHNVIIGGSFISTGNEASIHSRFHFRPHFYQHATFRVVEQLSSEIATSDTDAPGPYVGNYPFRRSSAKMLETAKLGGHQEAAKFNSLLSLHFGKLGGVFASAWRHNGLNGGNSFTGLKDVILSNAVKLGLNVATANAIEVGCGPGGLTFQLAPHFHSIIGVDHHAESVDFAKALIESTEEQTFTLRGEGILESSFSIPKQTISNHVEFRCADPMCLPAEMKGFDIVVLHDVLDKVSSPNSVLGRLGGIRGLVRPGGMLAIVGAYNWNEQRTPKSLWLGGYETPTGEISNSESTIIEKLSSEFVVNSSSQYPVCWHESIETITGKCLTLTVFQRKD